LSVSPRTFLFDLDGTLINSIELIYSCYRHAAKTHLGLTTADEVWRVGLGTPLRAQFRAISQDETTIEAMIVSYREHFSLHHDASISLYPDVADVLEALRDRGVQLGVVTSKLARGTERGLKLVGLWGLFDTIVSADQVTHAKPHPEPVEKAMERLGAEASTTVFIGDSPHDLAAGRQAGVRTAGVLWGPFRREELSLESPNFLLENPRDILAL
jgi:pyrophosphatase PpaX